MIIVVIIPITLILILLLRTNATNNYYHKQVPVRARRHEARHLEAGELQDLFIYIYIYILKLFTLLDVCVIRAQGPC